MTFLYPLSQAQGDERFLPSVRCLLGQISSQGLKRSLAGALVSAISHANHRQAVLLNGVGGFFLISRTGSHTTFAFWASTHFELLALYLLKQHDW